jgi:sRNA-binding carbon storage regulator CsrA
MTSGESRSNTVWDVAPGERLEISPGVSVSVLHKSGRRARLLVEAPIAVSISHVSEREEVIHGTGKAAPSLVT